MMCLKGKVKAFGMMSAVSVIGFAAPVASADEAYLESDGSQSIVTDFHPSPKSKAVMDLVFLNEKESSGVFAFGLRGSSTDNKSLVDFGFAMQRNNVSQVYFTNYDAQDLLWCGAQPLAGNVRATLVLDGPGDEGSFTAADGTSAKNKISAKAATRNKRANLPLTIFSCFDASGAHGGAKIRLYSFKLYEDGVLVRDYVPARSGTIAGLYDNVNGRFLSPRGNALAAGGDLKVVTDEAYLESDGTQAVVADFYADPQTRIIADCSFLNDAVSGTTEYIFGARGTTQALNQELKFGIGMSRDGSGNVYFAASDNSSIFWCGNQVLGAGVRVMLMLDGVVGKGSWTPPEGTPAKQGFGALGSRTQTSTQPIALFAAKDSSAVHNRSAIRFYSLQAYTRGEIQRDFVPAKRGNVAGVYDKVNGRFFTPEGGWLASGGTLAELPNDAYLETDGKQAIATDYYATPQTKVQVDYEYLSEKSGASESIVSARCGSDADAAKMGYNFGLQRNGDGKLYYACSNAKGLDWLGNYEPAVGHRLTVTLDAQNAQWVRKEVCCPAVSAATAQSGTGKGAYPLVILGNNYVGTVNAGGCRARLYSVKIWEAGQLVRHYVPYRNGTTVGLYDLVNGKVWLDSLKSGHAFAIGGAGTDDSGVALKVGPKDVRARRSRKQVVSAYAPGAVTYRWFRDGVEIAGETGPEVGLDWNGVGGVETIGVKPVYELNGKTYEGALATCRFDNDLPGGALIVR